MTKSVTAPVSEAKECFVVAPIGEPESETRRRSDQVLKYIIRPAVESCGYVAVRADEIDKPGIITTQVIQRVVTDPLMVADLTERNPNVFYELAIRHAIRKPLVQIIKKGEAIPFDIAGTRTIQVDHQDLDSAERAREEIVDQVRALEGEPAGLETPISVALDLQLLRQSDDPEERSLADLLAAITDIRGVLAKVEAKIGESEGKPVLDELRTWMKNLTLRTEEQADSGGGFLSRRQRLDAEMLYQLIHLARETSGHVSILILASFFRDLAPWMYEVGLETARIMRSGDAAMARKALEEFERVAEFSMKLPWMIGMGKERHLLFEELSILTNKLLRGAREDFDRTAGRAGLSPTSSRSQPET